MIPCASPPCGITRRRTCSTGRCGGCSASHIEQKGSLVDAEKTRFDFSHNKPITEEELREIERLVNEKIYSDLPVTAKTMPLAEAKKIAGVRAVFGEKYPDPVRVLDDRRREPGKPRRRTIPSNSAAART